MSGTSTKSIEAGDVVNYNGSSYVAIPTSFGFNPPEYLGVGNSDPNAKWRILADGLAGAAGIYTGKYFL